MKISATLLERKGACNVQVELFRRLFGARSVTVTKALCLKHAQEFQWDWAAGHLLAAPALKAYGEATSPARKAYDEATAQACKAYDEAIATAFAAAANKKG
jgi:hypothetical protein